MRNDSVSAGPARSLATVPTKTYTPAPSVDPTPAIVAHLSLCYCTPYSWTHDSKNTRLHNEMLLGSPNSKTYDVNQAGRAQDSKRC
jgi:hypothetical protein